MKIGFRTPNLKKRISARTTGVLKRKIKKSINPFYGKKGIGMISNPKKALYNKVYNKVTFDPLMLNKLIKSLNIQQQVSESDRADIIDSDEKILKRYIFSDKFKKLIVKNKKEHTKNFILENTLKKLFDGEIKTEEEIINYIIFLDNRMSFNKNLFKFILITYILIMIFILLGKK
jgi:hypothetical protein